jgi:TonB family protein
MTRASIVGMFALVIVVAVSLGTLRGLQPDGLHDSGSGAGFGSGSGSGSSPDPPPRPRAPIRILSGVEPPRKIVHVDPIWPEPARARDLRGIVIVELTIGTTGRVDAARIVRSVPGLDDAALDAVRQWTFTPARIGSEPHAIVVTMTVAFPPAAEGAETTAERPTASG